MPVVQRLMDELVARYGKERGERVYYAMEAEGKGPFGKHGKYRHLHEQFAAKHGLHPVEGKQKARSPKGPGPRSRR